MGRYSKTYSNYVLRKRHKTLEDGSTIFERDWGTLGERHVIERGKRQIYSDSGFLFTDNNLSGNKYRNNTGEWSDGYTQESLGDKIDSTVNDTSILSESNDIRDYAYYGSAVELVRSSVENIIKWFPGRFWATNGFIGRINNNEDGWMYISEIITDGHHNYVVGYNEDESTCGIYVIENPFTIDFYNKNIVLTKYDNALRNMPLSFKQYTINGYDINTWDVWAKPYTDCDDNYTIKYDITVTYGQDLSGHIYGVFANNDLIWCTNIPELVVQPKQNIVDEYLSNLDGFEAKLLSNKYSPNYTAKFITPIPYNDNRPDYKYVERSYTWPSDGYCIIVSNIGFENYFGALYDMASKMDELWCDNLWRNMTHEPITNFDWTYNKEYDEGNEVDNILGGTRMEGILRIWGRCFDDIKRYIDGINLKNCVTYDSTLPNLGNAELSDKATLLGWDIYSTKLNQSDNLYLTNDFINTYVGKLDQNGRWDCSESNNADCRAIVSYEKWFNSRNPESVSQNVVDNDFMNRLLLSTGEIFRTKGTKQAIEMVFGLFGIGNHDDDNPDFEIEEKYYTVFPKQTNNLFYYYKQNLFPEDTTEYTDYSSYGTLDNFLKHKPPYTGTPDIMIYVDGYYDLIQTDTTGDFCENMVYIKSAPINYEDDVFSGTPIKDVYINNTHYIVPYFNQDKIYDGYVYFESKGGWGKRIATGEDVNISKDKQFDYMETIPYMEVVQNVGGLLEVNPFQIGEKKIFYVMDISDCSEYDENIPTNLSHFFKLMNSDYPNLFSNWKNIPNDGVIDPAYDIFNGITPDDVEMAEYNNKLSFDNLGNNPHTGNSSYDLGTEYLEYLEMPFKHAIENYGFTNVGDEVMAKQFRFKVTEHNGDKIVNMTNKPHYILFDGGSVIHVGDFYYDYMYIEDFDEYEYIEKVATVDITVPPNNDKYFYIEYILPSKVLKIKNNIDNNCYKNYLKEVILKYVTQVIPSTTILILENFDGGECETVPPTPPKPTEDYNYYFTSRVNQLPEDFSIDDCISFGESHELLENGIEDLTIIAVPEDMTITLTYTSDGITSTVDECESQNCLVRINNSYVNGLPAGYKVLQYYVPNIETQTAEISLQFINPNYYYTANTSQLPNDFSIDNMQLSNETSIILPNGINDLTLIVVPEDRNVSLTYVSDGITSTIDECGEQICLIRIDNSYVNDMPYGYKVLQYYVPNITTTQAEINLE